MSDSSGEAPATPGSTSPTGAVTGSQAASALRIAAVEPYFGASHKSFLEGLQRHSRHHIELFTLPPRMWKWRVRGAALHFAPLLNEAGPFDVLLCSDFVNVADLRSLLNNNLRTRPIFYYLHENQLSYPLSPNEEFDSYFGFTNILSCLSAEAVVFNSEFHRREFLQHVPRLLPRLPDYRPQWIRETLQQRAEVLHVGLDLAELDAAAIDSRQQRAADQPRRILWNHRWEFDKRPEMFFAALKELQNRQIPFHVDIVGESFAKRPAVFDEAQEQLGAHLGQFGWVASRQEYLQLLWDADIVVSTAQQEFFGISMAEAVWCGAHPIAPRALVYEELYGGPGSDRRLYRDEAGLVELLQKALTEPLPPRSPIVRQRLQACGWEMLAPRFDESLQALAAAGC
jgi:glycosyltransferase involved in cell wall biosynthesis